MTNKKPFIIRNAKIEDSSTIVNAEKEVAQTPGIFCSQPNELTEKSVIETIKKLVTSQKGIYLVAEKEKRIVGHAFIEALPLKSLSHVAQLSICIHEGWQEKGIGTTLMQAIIKWAKSSDSIEKIELNVRETNDRAIALYKKMGFQEEGRLKNRVKLVSGYVDDLIMALDVNENLSDENL